MVYESCRLHVPVRKYIMSKLINNREILNFAIRFTDLTKRPEVKLAQSLVREKVDAHTVLSLEK